MRSLSEVHTHPSSRWITLGVAAVLILVSTVLMLLCASPEFGWDEADYAGNIEHPWHFLWSESDYNRHGHGPMMIYLAKLGQEVLPTSEGSLEERLRFFDALLGSVGVGFLYWILRDSFEATQAAALAGSALLLLSVIRLEQTDAIGPHQLMLTCTLAIVGLGYKWRDRPSLAAGIVLGAVMAFGALSMTYVIPAAVGWALAVGLAGSVWFSWDRTHFRVSWAVAAILVTATIIVLAAWPPGVLQHVIISNFRWYLHYPYGVTSVGKRMFEHAPRWAALYWLAQFDPVILVALVFVIVSAICNRSKVSRSKYTYLLVSLTFFLATALAAHLSGPRNLLQFIGVLCLATGALLDETLGRRPQLTRLVAAGIIVFAAVNLFAHSRLSSYAPIPGNDGYRAFVKENENRLNVHADAIVFNIPALTFYARLNGTPITWDLRELPWTTRTDFPISPDVKYVLMPAFVYDGMPPDQPMRRIVAQHWKVVWSHKRANCWELRLYEKPEG